jgi:hypothetical protein
MSELFEIPETLSPRLAWMDKHGIWTRKIEHGPGETPDPNFLWQAEAARCFAGGRDESEAIVNLAKTMGILLWNES